MSFLLKQISDYNSVLYNSILHIYTSIHTHLNKSDFTKCTVIHIMLQNICILNNFFFVRSISR